MSQKQRITVFCVVFGHTFLRFVTLANLFQIVAIPQLHVPIQALRDAGGWSKFATPGHYVAQQAIANDRIPLGNDLVAERDS